MILCMHLQEKSTFRAEHETLASSHLDVTVWCFQTSLLSLLPLSGWYQGLNAAYNQRVIQTLGVLDILLYVQRQPDEDNDSVSRVPASAYQLDVGCYMCSYFIRTSWDCGTIYAVAGTSPVSASGGSRCKFADTCV